MTTQTLRDFLDLATTEEVIDKSRHLANILRDCTGGKSYFSLFAGHFYNYCEQRFMSKYEWAHEPKYFLSNIRGKEPPTNERRLYLSSEDFKEFVRFNFKYDSESDYSMLFRWEDDKADEFMWFYATESSKGEFLMMHGERIAGYQNTSYFSKTTSLKSRFKMGCVKLFYTLTQTPLRELSKTDAIMTIDYFAEHHLDINKIKPLGK